MTEGVSRFIPLIGVILFVGLGFGWRAWRQYRRTGSSGIFLFRTSSWVQHARESALVALIVALLAQAAALAFSPEILAAFSMWGPAGPVEIAAGTVLLFGGLLLMLVAQLDLGSSWRIGFDRDARPGLVTGGFYRFCRNPIYLTLFVALAGFTLLMPTWLSLGFFVGTIVGIRNQVIEEELFLAEMYGADYRAYARRVGRFLPGLGLLA